MVKLYSLIAACAVVVPVALLHLNTAAQMLG